ncbi:MAG: CHAD domain-containing protein [Chloroflexota bacterium]|nr:CHAD domain-containing protein [Chloroflexota bacterium]
MAKPREVRGLRCDESARQAAGKVLWTRFEDMLSYRSAALSSETIEGVHDMRVATRRLRAALDLFRDVLPRRWYREVRVDVKRLARALGAVRDLEVTLERLRRDRAGRPAAQVLVLDTMVAELEQQRVAARENLTETLKKLEQSGFQRRFLATLAKETM